MLPDIQSAIRAQRRVSAMALVCGFLLALALNRAASAFFPQWWDIPFALAVLVVIGLVIRRAVHLHRAGPTRSRDDLNLMILGAGFAGMFMVALPLIPKNIELAVRLLQALNPPETDISMWKAVQAVTLVLLFGVVLPAGLPLAGLIWWRRSDRARILELRRFYALCVHCGYPRRGLDSDRCPECGQAFEPDPTPA